MGKGKRPDGRFIMLVWFNQGQMKINEVFPLTELDLGKNWAVLSDSLSHSIRSSHYLYLFVTSQSDVLYISPFPSSFHP